MAKSCRECGNELFIGERTCPRCRAVVPAEPVQASAGADASEGQADPPPEGVGLIIEKIKTDQEIMRGDEGGFRYDTGSRTYGDAMSDAFFGVDGGDTYDSYDQLADLVRPERDARGNIKVDLRYALVGAVVVAIAAGLVFWYVSGLVHTTSSFSRIS